MLGKHSPAVRIDLTELDGSHAGSLKSETKSANAAEEIKDAHPL